MVGASIEKLENESGKNRAESGVYSVFDGLIFKFQLKLKIAKMGLTVFI